MTGPRNLAISRSSAARIANLRRLVAELQQRTLRRSDIEALLGVGESGARRYIDDLRPLLEVLQGTGHYRDQQIFKLTDDAARVADFLANPSSRESAAVKVSRARIPQHDPILAALFGLVQPVERP